MTINSTLLDKVGELRTAEKSRDQKQMIDNLKVLGLMKSPSFSLAYGPNAISSVQLRG